MHFGQWTKSPTQFPRLKQEWLVKTDVEILRNVRTITDQLIWRVNSLLLTVMEYGAN